MATNSLNAFIRSGLTANLAIVIDLTVSNPQVSGGFVTNIPAGSAGGAIIAGDMLYLTANYGAASLSTAGSSNANAASFIGVSMDNYPSVVTDGIVAGFPAGDVAHVQYKREGQFRFHTTVGDTYHIGDLVYLGADGQTVQKTSSGTSVGKVSSDQRAVNGVIGTNLIGAVGQDVVITITPIVT